MISKRELYQLRKICDSIRRTNKIKDSIKDSYIDLDVDESEISADQIARKYGCQARKTGKRYNAFPEYRFTGSRDQLKRLARNEFDIDDSFFNELVVDSKSKIK